MTVCAIGAMNNRFQGDDGEQLTIENIENGATFYSINTGIKYIYHDGSWVEDISMIYTMTQALAE